MKLFRMLGRSIRDALKSVIRNFSLSLASISCITITLIIVAVAVIASFNVQNFTQAIEKDMTIVVFLDNDATEEDNGVYVITKEILENSCVTLYDYSRQISQTILPRQQLNEPILDVMAECIPFMRTALTNETGVLGMRVNSQDEYSNVAAANNTLKDAALNNKRYAPIVGNIEFQELTGGTPGESADFMQALESLDNFRLGL